MGLIKIRQTKEYVLWLKKLNDHAAKARIRIRIRRLELGNPGAVAPVGEGVSELKLDFGPGYRVYLMIKNGKIIILLCGGDKSTQVADILKAKLLAKNLELDDE